MRPGRSPANALPAGTAGSTGTIRPWALPPDAYPTQRLFRLEIDSAEESGTLRLVLRLESPARFRLAISDRLGRALYTVDAADGGGWLLDHRQRQACPLGPDLARDAVALGGFDVAVLPLVLLGRVPARPADQVTHPGVDQAAFHDLRGTRWTVQTREGEVASWTSWLHGAPAVWWRRLDGEALLSDREHGVQMRWRQVAREPLVEPLPPAAVPAGYTEGTCDNVGPLDAPPGQGGGEAGPSPSGI